VHGLVEAVAEGSAIVPGTTVLRSWAAWAGSSTAVTPSTRCCPSPAHHARDDARLGVRGALPDVPDGRRVACELALESGQTVLVRGANVVVGLACVELARAAGVRVVATSRSDAKAPELRRRGVEAIVLEGDGFPERALAALRPAWMASST